MACSPSSAADWPVARGDAAATGASEGPLADALEPLWKFDAGRDSGFEAGAVVAAGVVYVGDGGGGFHALRLADGAPIWSKKFDETWFTTAAAVGSGRVFVIDGEGVARGMSAQDGNVAWEFATESEAYAGPNLHADALLVTTETGELISLKAATGVENWRYTIDGPLRCSPSVSRDGAERGHVLLAGCDAKLHAVELGAGEAAGAVDIGGQTGSTPALAGGRAYFGTEAGEFLAVDTRDPAAPTVAWKYRDPRRGQGIRTAAAVTNEAVVYASQGKAVYALSLDRGEPLWTRPVRSRIESSPVIAGDRVIVATTRGRLMLLDLADGETVWEYDAGGRFTASPAVVGGRVVIGNTDGTLYCFGAVDAER